MWRTFLGTMFGLCLLGACSSSAFALQLGASGRIVLASSAIPAEEFAASELKSYLDRVTGSSWDVVAEAAHDGSSAIHVGATSWAAAFCPGPYLPEEYHLKVAGKQVFIAGGRPRGVLFGAYEFLERFAGVRFLSVNFEHVPHRASIDIPDGWERRHVPAFIYRDIYPGHASIPSLYRRKVRQNSGGGEAKYGFSESYGAPRGVHSMHIYSADFPPEISWMNKNGTRQVVSTPFAGSICFSQPEVLNRFASKLSGYISADRERCDKSGAPWPIFYVVDMNDCNVECFCPECQAMVKKHDVSGLVIDFMNRLWDRVSGDYPEVYLMMFAYHDSTTPPATDLRPRGQVIVRLAFMDHEFAGSGKTKRDILLPLSHPHNQPYDEIMTAWQNCATHLAIWDYWKLFRCEFQTPMHNLAAIPGLVRRYRDIGAKHFFVEMELGMTVPLSFFDLRYYLGAKMMDDPDIDPTETIADYMRLFYGRASDSMQQCKDYIEKRQSELATPIGAVKTTERAYLDTEFYTTLFRLLDQAEQAEAGNQAVLANIKQERLVVEHSYLYMRNKLGNPLQLDQEKLRQSIAELADLFGRKYFPATWAQNRGRSLEFFCDNMEFPQQAIIKARPLPGLDFAGHDILELNAKELDGGFLIDDPEAHGGQARLKDSEGKEDYHSKPFTYGIYDWKFKKHLSTATLAPDDVPQDEKYHWYYAGRTRVYSEQSRLWTHWSWTMNYTLKKGLSLQDYKQLYDVYLSVKLQGPAYVEKSTAANEIRVDRVIMVKVNADEQALAR